MIISTLNKNEPASMDNHVVVDFPHLDVGDTFTFKGRRLQVQYLSKKKTGFWYIDTNSLEQGYMSFEFYMTTPSAKGRRLTKGI